MYDIHTLLPDGSAALDAAELAGEKRVEAVEVLFGPFDTGASHYGGETLLVDTDGVFDEAEVDVGDLEDVEGEVSFEDAGTEDAG